MKKIMAILFLLTSFQSMAEVVFLYPTCNAFNSECTVYNSSGKVVSCNIQVMGYTKSGSSVNAFDSRILYQGMSAWVRVYTSNPMNDPIVSLNGNAFCNTIN